ncbi:GatB/YqeY domain-containing protein [Palleronia sediminis]|uniref:GatB/YqeY domain-containing protein n=1 Tax=Palleronia sediminis TaxID=2547833 RepID=A0A4R6AA42_9RHOB|nr:GatB/YqeY domain-containing protein [Palleronia sediminis]TDL79785.1 GatB/YqeY domain-containing protein [Palleronia sediminis]
MQLRDRINAAMKAAMRDKEQKRLSTLRLITAAIKDRDIAQRGTEEGGAGGVSDDEVLQILGRMVKQRQESARMYEEGGRLELAEDERREIEVIGEFLPRQLDEAEVEAAIDDAVTRLRASSIRDMGRVMGELKSRYTGQMDFSTAGPRVKARLSRQGG